VRNEKLESVLPSWAPDAKTKLNLGLDLQGGIHLVLGVDTQSALRAKAARRADQIQMLAKEKGFSKVQAKATELKIKLTSSDRGELDRFEKVATSYYEDMRISSRADQQLDLVFGDQSLSFMRKSAVDQAMKVISNRVNKWGVTEPIIAVRGDDSILVQLPGYKDPAKAKELLGKTAQLEFKIVDDEDDYFGRLFAFWMKTPPEGMKIKDELEQGGRTRQYLVTPKGKTKITVHQGQTSYLEATGEDSRRILERIVSASTEPAMPAEREMGLECIASKTRANQCDGYRTYLLKSKVELTGESIVDAYVAQGNSGNSFEDKPYVSLQFDPNGARDFERVTGENVRRRLAIVLDKTVYSAPVIQTKIAGNASITMGGGGSFDEIMEEANDLALVLKAGALPAPVTIGEERTVGASLGPELIRKGSYAVLVGFCLVIAFMAFYYRTTGLVANSALLLNGIFNLAAMAAFNATLTLPGIASFVLTLGIAVDANVLINERIREELRHGKTLRAAVEAGYGRAFWTIFDSHVTTLVAGFVLLHFGTGPVKGFAVMLIIGISASLFTSIVVTRLIMDWLVIGRKWHRISV
jgi:preprotein translocase subunit SecD